MQGLGACYRLVVRSTDCSDRLGGTKLERDIIAQSVNTGFDVSNIQFDLQMGNGGTGAFNNCAGDSWSMFPGQVRVGVSEVIVTLQDLSTEVSGELSTEAASTETRARAVPAVTTFPRCPRCRG